MTRLLVLAALCSSATLAQPAPAVPEPVQSPTPATSASATAPQLPKRLAKALAKADGRTQASAIKVRSIDDEYVVIGALGFRPGIQSLVSKNGKTYDVHEVTHATTGERRTFWFDVSSFFGRGFGF